MSVVTNSTLTRQAAFARAVHTLTRRRSWDLWTRGERAVYVRRELLEVTRSVRQITRGRRFPIRGTVPRFICEQVDEMLDALNDFHLSGQLHDWVRAHHATRALRLAYAELVEKNGDRR